MRKFSAGLVFLAPSFFILGCSTFERDWERAPSPAGDTGGLAGRRQGSWVSAVNGHTYRGEVRGDDFHSEYSSADDHGTFQMRRVR